MLLSLVYRGKASELEANLFFQSNKAVQKDLSLILPPPQYMLLSP